jgi:hypothetical protein
VWAISKFVLIGLFMLFVMAQMYWIVVRWNGLPEETPEAKDAANERPR